MQHPRELLNAYVCGQNIISLLKDSFASDRNTEEMIELAYDLQTGSYIEALNDPDVLKYNMQYGRAIAEEILKELYRVASRYLILLEPGYELSSEKSQRRMREHGYCRDLVMHAGELNMQVIRHELFPSAINPLNPLNSTAITVISKNPSAASAVPSLACPRFGDPLMDYGDSLFSPDSLRAYPKILGIPCLRQQDGIVASKYESYNSN